MQDHSPQSLERMEAMLRHCRRRIMMAVVTVRLRDGIEFYLKCLVVSAGLFLMLRVLTYALDRPVVIHWGFVLVIAASFAALVFGRAIMLGIWGKPVHLAHAAERLDLSQTTHNRIATAIALLRSGDDTPFAKAAIADGFETLEKLQGEEPQVELSTTSWRRKGAYLSISLAMVLAGLFLAAESLSPRSGSLPTAGTTATADGDPRPSLVTPDLKTAPKPQLATRTEREPTTPPPPREDDPSDSARDKRATPGNESRSEGPASQHASGKSRSSQSASVSSSAASGAGVKAEPGSSEPGAPKKPQEPKKQTAAQPKVDPQTKKGGSISARGSSGAGSMRTTQNEWSSEVKAKSSDIDDKKQEEEPDEQTDQENQRLGKQPNLKNRTSNVSRELSIAMGMKPDNSMKKGRSGPNAAKKTRGTATMVMGVPVPGFVKGRLLPGPTKSTQEEVEPTPREGPYVTASDLPTAHPEETRQEHYRPSAATSDQARDYLIKYHTENDNSNNSGAATTK